MKGAAAWHAMSALALLIGCGRIHFDDVQDSGPCGKTTLITDDFDNAVTDPIWQPYMGPAATAMESGGELVIVITPSTAQRYAGYNSRTQADLTSSRVFVEVTRTPSPGVVRQYLHVKGDDANKVGIQESDGQLLRYQDVANTRTDLPTVPYDAVASRWWQFREDGGTLYVETSPDGASWLVLDQIPTPSWAPWTMVELGAGADINGATDEGHFDALSGGRPSRERWCSASTLADGFDDGVSGWQWDPSSSGSCTISQPGGAVVVTPGTGINSCSYESSTQFDVSNGAATIEVLQTLSTSDPNTYTFLRAHDVSGRGLAVEQRGGNLDCLSGMLEANPSTLASVPFDAVAHAWWRIREAGGTMSCETSPDGVSWRVVASQPDPVPPTAVAVQFGAGTRAAVTSPGIARFDNYNAPP